jgi:membrane dipeptidase
MFIIDAHLDLAYNASRGRDVLKPAAEQVSDNTDIPTVGLPDLRAGGVSLVCATIFAEPDSQQFPGYKNADEAHAAGMWQMQWYLDREREGQFRIIRRPSDVGWALPTKTVGSAHPTLPIIILLEGADPIRNADEVPLWVEHGVRIVGLSWKQTRYAGGTGAPGPLTPEGVALAKALDTAGIIHDASHLAEQSLWQLLDLTTGPLIASHSNCRHYVPTDRQLSDDMIRAIINRGGVIGINFFDRFLIPHGQPKRRATLADVILHMQHICDLAGSARHVAIGTDMDGGLGRNEIPQEITSSAALPKLAGALNDAGFDDTAVQDIMGENWRRFFATNL